MLRRPFLETSLRGRCSKLPVKLLKKNYHIQGLFYLSCFWPHNDLDSFLQMLPASLVTYHEAIKGPSTMGCRATRSVSFLTTSCGVFSSLRRITKPLIAYMWGKGNLIISLCISNYLTPELPK